VYHFIDDTANTNGESGNVTAVDGCPNNECNALRRLIFSLPRFFVPKANFSGEEGEENSSDEGSAMKNDIVFPRLRV